MTYQDRSSLLVDKIYSHTYFIDKFETTLVSHNMTAAGIKSNMYTHDMLWMFWNNFWYSIPQDTSSPFLELTVICEERPI